MFWVIANFISIVPFSVVTSSFVSCYYLGIIRSKEPILMSWYVLASTTKTNALTKSYILHTEFVQTALLGVCDICHLGTFAKLILEEIF